jgi:hypothetical protein
MGYIENPEMVRVDFFKESGKWYTTIAMKWVSYSSTQFLIYDVFRESLRAHFKESGIRFTGMWAVCLEPYHEHAHPLMIKWDG